MDLCEPALGQERVDLVSENSAEYMDSLALSSALWDTCQGMGSTGLVCLVCCL